MARSCVKWLLKQDIHVLTMSPAKKDYGHHNYPLERVETAINWLKNHGIHKIGIVGASTTGTLALTAASYFADITLTIGMEKRLAERPHTCEVETAIYPYATHFVFPEGLIKIMLPVGSGLFVKMAFQSAKKHPKECKSARVDIDRRITATIESWKKAAI